MTKTITHINCPKEWYSENDWDSHRPLLWLIANNNLIKTIIEVGVGDGSTPLLKSLKNKTVYSFETNKEWADKYDNVGVLSTYKNLSSILDDDGIGRLYGLIDLLFVDSSPGEERKEIIELFSNDAKVIVTHDTEPGAEYVYGMSKILNSFKYRLDYQPKGKPHTTAVSNFIDVTKWTNKS